MEHCGRETGVSVRVFDPWYIYAYGECVLCAGRLLRIGGREIAEQRETENHSEEEEDLQLFEDNKRVTA